MPAVPTPLLSVHIKARNFAFFARLRTLGASDFYLCSASISGIDSIINERFHRERVLFALGNSDCIQEALNPRQERSQQMRRASSKLTPAFVASLAIPSIAVFEIGAFCFDLNALKSETIWGSTPW